MARDYPELLMAMRDWAIDRIPGYGMGRSVGCVAIAATEMYYAFEKIEETTYLERMFQA